MQPNKKTKRVFVDSVLISFAREMICSVSFSIQSATATGCDVFVLYNRDAPHRFLLVHYLPVGVGSSFL